MRHLENATRKIALLGSFLFATPAPLFAPSDWDQ
jgi:hypothetical protein